MTTTILWRGACVAALFLMLSARTFAGGGHSLESMRWLLGSWTGESGGAKISEQWTWKGNYYEARGAVVAGGDTVVRELLEIRQIGDFIVFIALVNDGPPVLFTLTGVNDRKELVFENPQHDFPSRVIYAPGKSGGLYARIEGMMDGKPMQEEYNYSSAGK